jgi:hypothetical protein
MGGEIRRPLGALVDREVIPAIWPQTWTPTATRHIGSYMSAWGATLGPGNLKSGTKGLWECRGFWDRGLRESAHNTVLELATVRVSLEEFGAFVGLHRGIWSVSGPTTR